MKLGTALRVLWFSACAAAVLVILRAGWHRASFSPSAAIVNGTPIKDAKRYPYFASLMYGKTLFCGGVLIKPDTVLTAAHCLSFGKAPEHLLKQMVTVQLGLGEEVHRIKEMYFHPMLDLTLIVLQTPSKKQPIKLATRLPANSTAVTLIGRGMKSDTDFSIAFTKAQLTFKDNPAFLRLIKQEPNMDAKQKEFMEFMMTDASDYHVAAIGLGIGLGTPSSAVPGACGGDSGGPLIIEKGLGADELLGLASWLPQKSCMALSKYTYQLFSSIPHLVKNPIKFKIRGSGDRGSISVN